MQDVLQPRMWCNVAAAGEDTGVSALIFDEFAHERLLSLVRYATMLTQDRELAEDVVQDVLVRAHGRWNRIAVLDRPDLYVKRMVTNEYFSWRRRRRVATVPLLPELAEAAVHARPPSHEEASADREALWGELNRLPRQQRVVLILRFYEGLTDREIASVLGCRPTTVRGYAARALATLRIDLAEWRTESGDQP